jgi:hypothetical protein
MGVVIRFPKSRPLTKLEMREALRARYADPVNWRASKEGHPYIWLEAVPATPRWVKVYRRCNGGWSWGSGRDEGWLPMSMSAMWSPKTYDSEEIARRKAWLTALSWIEWERDEAMGLHDDGDAA